jgi:ABC-type transport system involved in multi-copper enzyme maturation permease subunit
MALAKLRIFGPILTWEMLTLVRRRRYFWIRAAYATILFFVLWSTYESVFSSLSRRVNPSNVAIDDFSIFASIFFSSFSVVQLTAVLLLTPAYLATSIAIEKDRRTIEYLFASDLTNQEIVLGKWASRVLNVAMLVLAGLPVVALARFFGGIDWDQVMLSTVLSVNCAAATAAVAILVSVYSRNIRQALVTAYLIVALLLASPWLWEVLGEGIRALAGCIRPGLVDRQLIDRFVATTFVAPSEIVKWAEPYFVFSYLVSGARLDEAPTVLVWMTTFHWTVVLACLGLAVVRVRAVYRREQSREGGRRRGTTSFGFRRVPAVGDRPMIWKEWYFDRRHTSAPNRIIAGLLILGLIAWIVYQAWTWTVGSAEAMNVVLRLINTAGVGFVYLMVAMRAASTIGTERDRDTWVALLATPMGADEILKAKLLGSMKPLFALIAALGPFWIAAVFLDALSILAIPVMLLAILIYGVFVASIGLHHSLARPTTAGAIGSTIGLVSLFFGLGQSVISCGFGLFFVALFPVGFGEIVPLFWFASFPWVVLGVAPFRNDELEDLFVAHSSNNQSVPAFVAGLCFLLLFAGMAFVAFHSSVAQFNRRTGRTDLGAGPPITSNTKSTDKTETNADEPRRAGEPSAE